MLRDILTKAKSKVKTTAQNLLDKATPKVQEKVSEVMKQSKDDILKEVLVSSGKILFAGVVLYRLSSVWTTQVLPKQTTDILREGVRISCRTYNEVHNTYNITLKRSDFDGN